jgi:hypothetical protein
MGAVVERISLPNSHTEAIPATKAWTATPHQAAQERDLADPLFGHSGNYPDSCHLHCDKQAYQSGGEGQRIATGESGQWGH